MSYHVEILGTDKERLKAALRARQFGVTKADGTIQMYGPPAHEVEKVCGWIDTAMARDNFAYHVKLSGHHSEVTGGTESAELRVIEAV